MIKAIIIVCAICTVVYLGIGSGTIMAIGGFTVKAIAIIFHVGIQGVQFVMSHVK